VGEPFADSAEPSAAEGDGFFLTASLACTGSNLCETENAEGDGDEGQPVAEEQAVEGEAFLGCRGGGANHAQEQTQEPGRDSLDDVAAGEHRCEGDTQDGQHEQFGACEGQDQGPGQRDGERKADGSDDAAGHGGQECQRQGSCRLTLFGHGVPVEHGDAG
jgi:hypothetical protein